jgi:hypothetical protein
MLGLPRYRPEVDPRLVWSRSARQGGVAKDFHTLLQLGSHQGYVLSGENLSYIS